MADASESMTLDPRLLLETAEALGSEPTLERLVERLMRISMRAVAADRSVLVLNGQQPVLRGTATADGDVTLTRTPLSESVDVPAEILAQVLRHGRLVVSADAMHDAQCAADPYVARVGIRCLLAVPLRRQEHTTGILYLEKHSAAAVFTPEHVETFRLLSPLMAMALDMIGARAVEERLERSLSLLQAAVEATADGILVVDRTGKVTLVNQRLLALWNLSAQEVEGADERALLDAMLARVEDPDGFRAGVLGLQDRPEREHADIIRLRDGRTYERYTHPQRIGDAFVGRIWSYRDISERERLLRRAVFLADATRLLVSLDVERALDAVAQLMVPDLADGCVIDLLDEGSPRRSLAVSRDPRNPISFEVHPSVLGGRPILYQVHSTSYLGVPIGVKDRIVGAMTLAAPPHRKYTQTDLELAEELGSRIALCIDNARLHQRAQEALRARDELLSIASHEIRGPMTSLHLAVHMLRGGQIPQQAHASTLELIEREGRRLSRFVDELLDVGRIRAGTLRFELEDVDLGDVVRNVTSSLGLELARSGSVLVLEIKGQVRGAWDRLRLDQIVTNLLSNAIKFGLGKPISVSVSTRNDSAVLVVSDQGMGMAADLRARIFRPFERGVPVRHYGGLGLGLYIVKTLVDGFGGHISVESTLGTGSKFTVDLPRVRTVDADSDIDSRR
jgi:PAS domain S-box-containing protein